MRLGSFLSNSVGAELSERHHWWKCNNDKEPPGLLMEPVLCICTADQLVIAKVSHELMFQYYSPSQLAAASEPPCAVTADPDQSSIKTHVSGFCFFVFF